MLSKRLQLEVVYTRAAERVAELEENVSLEDYMRSIGARVYRDDEIDAPISSSSNAPDAVVVVPCSLAMLAKIAHGIGEGLAARVALNALRMRRPLILVIRETPISTIDALNMLLVSLAGGVILPAAPAFYHKPSSVQDMVDFIVGKVLDVLGLEHGLYKRWEGVGTAAGSGSKD